MPLRTHVKMWCGSITTKHAIYNNMEDGLLTSHCSCSDILAPCGEQDDKGIQVDTQDLGYDTSGRSETEVEREEGSSTGRQEGISSTNYLFFFYSLCGNLPNLVFLVQKKKMICAGLSIYFLSL